MDQYEIRYSTVKVYPYDWKTLPGTYDEATTLQIMNDFCDSGIRVTTMLVKYERRSALFQS